MANDIGLALRRAVKERAAFCCEYCRMPEAELLAGCEVDHIISRKHGGLTWRRTLAREPISPRQIPKWCSG